MITGQIVGTCGCCGGDARFVVQNGARLVVCDCPDPLVPAPFFARAMSSPILYEAIRIPLEATIPDGRERGIL